MNAIARIHHRTTRITKTAWLWTHKVIRMTSTEVGRGQHVAAVCQMTCTANKQQNMESAVKLVQTAVAQGAQMVFLPEACDYIANSKEESVLMSEDLEAGDTIEQYRQLATDQRVWLSLGGIHQRYTNVKSKNSHVLIDDKGQIVAVYDKVHLFDIALKTVTLRESDYTCPGERIVPPVKTPIGKVGLGICYDLRFPELATSLRDAGAEILTYPSAFTVTTGRAHWEVLLRNKAIENQCYVIAAAQTGKHNEKRSSYGHAMIVNPWGDIVASCGEDVGVALATIDLEFLRGVRRQLPLRDHQRRDLYATVSHLSTPAPCGGAPIPGGTDKEGFSFGPVLLRPSQIFYETATTVAFVNRKPVIPGHVLVAPKRPARRLRELSAHEVSDLFSSVQLVQKAVEEQHGAGSSTVAIQDGPEAGQTIEHVHVHVLPRKKGDFDRNDDIYKKLEERDSARNLDAKEGLRSQDDMESEAKLLRQRMAAQPLSPETDRNE